MAYWTEKYDRKMRELAQEGLQIGDAAARMKVNTSTLRRYAKDQEIEFAKKDMHGIPKKRKNFGKNIKILNYNTNDPRSFACQQIEVCSGQGCYRKDSCPAHDAYQGKVGIYGL